MMLFLLVIMCGLSIVNGQVFPGQYFFSAETDLVAVNGSSSTGRCLSFTNRKTCLTPTNSVLFDGNAPTLTGLDGDMWASQLLTINTTANPAEITFDFTATPNYTGMGRVEVVMFNCPEWGISVRTINLHSATSTLSNRNFETTSHPTTTSCDSLVRVCISNTVSSVRPVLTLEFNSLSTSNWVHLAEVTFYASGSACPPDTIITPLPTTPPPLPTTQPNAPPSPPTGLSSSSIQSTFITLTWSQPTGDIVDSYIVTYSFTIRVCGVTGGSTVMVGGSSREYTLTDLEENSDYTISITARNEAGDSPSTTTIMATTSRADPSAPPINLSANSTSPTSITIMWGEVPCADRNTEITDYSLSYGPTSDPNDIVGIRVDDDIRTFTTTGLIPRTEYTVKVRAEHISLRGVVTTFLTGPFSSTTVTTRAPEAVGFFLNDRIFDDGYLMGFNGRLYPNNSVVFLTDIGEGNDTLFCLTDKLDCCVGEVDGVSAGEWYLPGQTDPVVGSDVSGGSEDFTRYRRSSAVLLNRRSSAVGPTGLYRCLVPDKSGVDRELYIGVGLGVPTITRSLDYNRTTLTLTCTSSGGPVDSVTWLKDGSEVRGDSFVYSQTITDAVMGTYQHTLTGHDISLFVGTFTCRVRDGAGNTNTRTLAINGVTITSDPLPFIVGSRSEAVCSSDSGVVDRIEWLSGGGTVVASAKSVQHLMLVFDPVNDSLSLHNSDFTCLITRDEGTPVETVSNQTLLITVEVPPGSITASVSQSGSVVVGSEFTLTCVITQVIPGLTNMPSATWLGINSEPVTSGNGITLTTSRNDTSATAILNFNPLKVSHDTVYRCIGNLATLTQGEPLQVMNEARFRVQIPTPVVSITVPPGPLFAGEVEALTCTATLDLTIVDFGDILYSFTWRDREGNTVVSGSRTNITQTSPSSSSSLTLSPLNTTDTNFTCTVIAMESMNRLVSSAVGVSAIGFIVDIPPPTVVITGSPIDSNFFTGLQLNLTCHIHIPSELLSVLISVTTQWTMSGTDLTSNSRLTVEEDPVQVGPLLYQTSLVFNSLDRRLDNGNYTCSVTVNAIPDSVSVRSATVSTTKAITVETTFFQLRLTGITNCQTWRTSDTASKDRDILNAIINNIDPRCGCVLNEYHFTNRGFQCFPSSPQAVTYHVELHGTHQASVSELIVYLEEWISSEITISVQFLILSIDESCTVEVSSIAEEECRATTGLTVTTGSEGSTVMPTVDDTWFNSTVIVVGVVVLLVVIGIVVIVALILRNRRLALNLQRSAPISAVQLSSFTPDPVEESHVYEDIYKYCEAKTQPTTVPPPPVPASLKDDYELIHCPAYSITDTQSLSTMEESEERQYVNV